MTWEELHVRMYATPTYMHICTHIGMLYIDTSNICKSNIYMYGLNNGTVMVFIYILQLQPSCIHNVESLMHAANKD